MTRIVRYFAQRCARVLSLAMVAMIATILLVRLSPGYFTDSREMDAQYGAEAREALAEQQQREGSTGGMILSEVRAWAHGDLGVSRHFDVPVSSLLKERAAKTARLVLLSVLCGWLGALTLAIPLSLARTSVGHALVAAPMAVLLAAPVSALATACLLANVGGPVFVLSALIGVRDFQFVYRVLRHEVRAPHFLYARAQGLAAGTVLRRHLVPVVGPELLALAMTSFVLALSAAVPVEVIFDIPGLGQLAWNAAMNRDLPVLLAVTLVMVGCVGLGSLFADAPRAARTAECV